jgi:hypothetical protein
MVPVSLATLFATMLAAFITAVFAPFVALMPVRAHARPGERCRGRERGRNRKSGDKRELA